MVERAYPVRRAPSFFPDSEIGSAKGEIEPSAYDQDIAGKKKEQILHLRSNSEIHTSNHINNETNTGGNEK